MDGLKANQTSLSTSYVKDLLAHVVLMKPAFQGFKLKDSMKPTIADDDIEMLRDAFARWLATSPNV